MSEALLVPFCPLQETGLISSPKLAQAQSRGSLCLIWLPRLLPSVPSLIMFRHLLRGEGREKGLEGGESNNAFFLAAGESNNAFFLAAGESNKGPMCCDLLGEFNSSMGIVPFSPVSPPFPLPFPFFFLFSSMAWGAALQRTHGSRLASQGRGPRL